MRLEDAFINALNEKVRAIGQCLGFVFDEEYAAANDCAWDYRAQIKSGQKCLSFAFSEYKTESRLVVRGEFPMDAKGRYHHDYHSQKWPGITVSWHKPAEKIAKDIQSRLLPEYEWQLSEAIINIERTNQYHQSRLNSMRNLADFLGLPLPDSDDNCLYPGDVLPSVYRIEPDEEEIVKFEVKATTNQAIDIFRILGAKGSGGQE